MRNFFDKDFTVGVLGGGQLGRMLIEAAGPLNVRLAVLDPSASAPCSEVAHTFTSGDFADFDAVVNFGKEKDVLTVEIEHVSVPALYALQAEGIKVYPRPQLLEIVQDKGLQKLFFEQHQIPTARFALFNNGQEAVAAFGAQCVLKLRKGGYDGRGVQVVKNNDTAQNLFDAPVVAEEAVQIDKELSVIVSRNEQGECAVFPSVEMLFNPEANLVELLFSPAQISEALEHEARTLALKTAAAFELTGIMAVEMFLTKSGQLMVNEVAPRPHNSGHHTIEANITSQYQQHLRAILNLPPGDTSLRCPAAMINVLGEKGHNGPVLYQGIDKVLEYSGAYIHLYGKSDTKPYRKMGHITALGDTVGAAVQKAKQAGEQLKVVSAIHK
jgi:5-(carboxyamino)imidazole ribonucleotide synthase